MTITDSLTGSHFESYLRLERIKSAALRDRGTPEQRRAILGKIAAELANEDMPKVTGAQIRAARAFLKWTVVDLASKADVGISTVQKIEDVNGDARIVSTLQWRTDARNEAVAKIEAALTEAGITFLDADERGPGFRVKTK